MLLNRSWISAEDGNEGKESETQQRFRVMQWNTLADALSPSTPTENFVNCPTPVLAWENRKEQLLAEIKQTKPDVICLEEVDHFPDFFQPELEKLGFKGSFLAKPFSPCLKCSENSGPDGCAVFFKESVFELKAEHRINLQDSERKQTNQVALALVLSFSGETSDKQTKKALPVCIAATHLKSKSTFSALRAAQGKHLLDELATISADMPTIVCGDFNADPDEDVCDLFRHHEPPYSSVYPNEPDDFTTWKFRPNGEACHTIDYIWFRPTGLRAGSRLALASKAEIGGAGLPCIRYPSDHLALACDFVLLR
eukprot:scpid81401/ scgid14761/ Nocturnin; Rhythmic message 1